MNFFIRHPQRCSRKLGRGDAKRMYASGPLLGYTIVCPNCGFPGSYLNTEAEYEEIGPWVTMEGPASTDVFQSYRRPTSVSARKPLYCFGCHHTISLRDNELTTVAPAPLA